MPAEMVIRLPSRLFSDSSDRATTLEHYTDHASTKLSMIFNLASCSQPAVWPMQCQHKDADMFRLSSNLFLPKESQAHQTVRLLLRLQWTGKV